MNVHFLEWLSTLHMVNPQIWTLVNQPTRKETNSRRCSFPRLKYRCVLPVLILRWKCLSLVQQEIQSTLYRLCCYRKSTSKMIVAYLHHKLVLLEKDVDLMMCACVFWNPEGPPPPGLRSLRLVFRHLFLPMFNSPFCGLFLKSASSESEPNRGGASEMSLHETLGTCETGSCDWSSIIFDDDFVALVWNGSVEVVAFPLSPPPEHGWCVECCKCTGFPL